MKITLLELRARKRLTQKEVASDLGVAPPTYCNWERDFSKVGLKKAKEVADYYGVLVDDIIFDPKNFTNQHELNSPNLTQSPEAS